MWRRITDWLSSSERGKRAAGKELAALLLLLSVREPSKKSEFVLLTIRQRHPHIVFLLRWLGLEDDASEVDRFDWSVGKGRFDRALKVFGRVEKAVEPVMRDEAKDRALAASALYVDARMSIKHAYWTQLKFWKNLAAGTLDELSSDLRVDANPARAALREAATQTIFLLRIVGQVEGSSKNSVNERIQAACEQQVASILS